MPERHTSLRQLLKRLPMPDNAIRKARRRAEQGEQTRSSASQTVSALPELSDRSSAVSCGASVQSPVSMSQTSMNSPSTSGMRSCAGTTPFSVSTCTVPSPRICSAVRHSTPHYQCTNGKKDKTKPAALNSEPSHRCAASSTQLGQSSKHSSHAPCLAWRRPTRQPGPMTQLLPRHPTKMLSCVTMMHLAPARAARCAKQKASCRARLP